MSTHTSNGASTNYDRTGILRGGLTVTYRRLKVPVAEFVYEGRDQLGTLHLWQEDGTWRAQPHADPHKFDLMLTAPARAGRA